MWYRFTAQTANPTIYLTGLGANFTSAALQVATSCTAGPVACGGTTLALTGLTITTTYYIRVFSTAASTPTTNAGFSITVVDRPANDLVAAAILLTPTITCELNVSQQVNQSIALANYEAAATTGTCTNVSARDVWYKFVANDTTHNILISNLGSSWGNNLRIQLLTNTDPANGSGTWQALLAQTLSSLSASTKSVHTYYIRIHRNNTAATTDPNWRFDICLINQLLAEAG